MSTIRTIDEIRSDMAVLVDELLRASHDKWVTDRPDDVTIQDLCGDKCVFDEGLLSEWVIVGYYDSVDDGLVWVEDSSGRVPAFHIVGLLEEARDRYRHRV